MADASTSLDPSWAWQPYEPTEKAPWNLQRVGHLYRRAGFGATHAELQEGLRLGPHKLVARLLEGGPGLAEFNEQMAPLARTIAQSNDARHLRAWWLVRMLHSPHPLQEKLTLFWHNHFATSNSKVLSAHFMLEQNALLRKHALGSFAELLQQISQDPAMMIWLDTRDSKKGSPNENYARELMELFSLGIGHYTEKDIREAARAFTGWQIRGQTAIFDPAQHDNGLKTVLGQKGSWTGEDIVRICLEQKAAAPFIVTKLYRFLVSEAVPPSPELLAPLAEQFRTSDYDFGGLVKTVLSSNLFFSSRAYRSSIKSPVLFALGIVRALEGQVGATSLVDSLQELGQDVFHPPSVKGWDGGQAWLNGQTLLFRQNLALALTSTEDPRFGRRTDPAALVRKYGKSSDDEVLTFFVQLFLQGDVPAASLENLRAYQQRSRTQPAPVYWSAEDKADHRIRSLCHLVLSLPEFQLD